MTLHNAIRLFGLGTDGSEIYVDEVIDGLGGAPIYRRYLPISELHPGLVLNRATVRLPRGNDGGGRTSPPGPALVVQGPPAPPDGIWNLSDGTTIDANASSLLLVEELTEAEALALLEQ